MNREAADLGAGREAAGLEAAGLEVEGREAAGLESKISRAANLGAADESFPESWSWRNSPRPPGAAVIVDMDGVISNAAARQHYLNAPPKDWRGFFNACDQDPPILATTTLLRQLDPDLMVILLTARPSWVRQKTLQWLNKHKPRWDLLILRSLAEDKLLAGDYKLRSLQELQQRGFDLRVGFEDDPKNVAIFSDFGLPCIYIHSGYYEHRKGRSPMG